MARVIGVISNVVEECISGMSRRTNSSTVNSRNSHSSRNLLPFFYASLARYPVHVYVSASRKLRLQCGGSLLSLLALLSAVSSSLPRFPSSSSSSVFLLSVTYYLPVDEDPPFFLERDAELSPSSPTVYLSGTGTGKTFYSHWCGEGGNSEG